MKYIPIVSKEEINRRAEIIKPVIMHNDVLMYIKPVNLYSVAYTWSAEFTTEAKGIIPCGDFKTYHSWSYYGFFKPTIFEVLAQIPEKILDVAVAFEIIRHPEDSHDLNKDLEALNEGYHVATTRFYKKG